MPAVAQPLETPTSSTRVSKKTSNQTREPKVTAESMALRQRDISVSEFFAKNRHLLGFDNPRKALLTTVKEAVDNALDACEEASILPDITIVIEDLSEAGSAPRAGSAGGPSRNGSETRAAQSKTSRYRITVIDNGPGIVRKQVENIFGRLLYGSKFHRLKMSRGQQGIGISAAGMFGLITTGKPMAIQTRPSAHKPAHHIELAMNTKTNRAEVTVDEETDDFPLARLRNLTTGTRELAAEGKFLSPTDYPTGTSVSIELEGRYQKGRGSVDEFLELTAIANPHARITFVPPTRESAAEDDEALLPRNRKAGGSDAVAADSASDQVVQAPALPQVTTELSGLILFPRAVSELPPETKEIQPHPKGIELGILLQMLKESEQDEKGYTLYNFLQDKFCRVSAATAGALCQAVGANKNTKVADVDHAQAERLFKHLQEAKLPPPPTDCLAPIGVQQLLKGMFKGVRAEFYAASTREANVYRGRPFQIEAAIAFGGELPTEDTARVIRFANRVPLLFQQSACSSFKAVIETAWKNYNLQQPRGSVPVGPIVVMIHMASVWVPFTSESKEAIADYDEIRKEMKLALMECGRKLGTYLRKRHKMRREAERRDVFERYIGEITKAVHAINGTDARKLYDTLLAQARKLTAIADIELDEDGKAIKEHEHADRDGVIIIESAQPAPTTVRGAAVASGDPIFKQSKAEAAMLKVAALAKGDDPQQRLINTEPTRRLSRKGEPPSKKSSTTAKTSTYQTKPSKKTGAAPSPVPRARPAPAASGTKPKPRMRLVNGKMVPVDDGPALF